MEDLLYRHLDRIRQIDRILKAPVESLIGMAAEGGSAERPTPLRFTRWVAEQGKPQQGQFRTTSGLCISTLQRIPARPAAVRLAQERPALGPAR